MMLNYPIMFFDFYTYASTGLFDNTGLSYNAEKLFDLEIGRFITEHTGNYIILELKNDPSPYTTVNILVNVNDVCFYLNIVFVYSIELKCSQYSDYLGKINIKLDKRSIPVTDKLNSALEWFFDYYAYDKEIRWNWENKDELINGLKEFKKSSLEFIKILQSEDSISMINDTNNFFNLIL